MAERIHVLPVGDLKPHIENGEWCHCQPRVDGDLVIHNAYDGREFYERGSDENINDISCYTREEF